MYLVLLIQTRFKLSMLILQINEADNMGSIMNMNMVMLPFVPGRSLSEGYNKQTRPTCSTKRFFAQTKCAYAKRLTEYFDVEACNFSICDFPDTYIYFKIKLVTQ
jgi:hypothetical protein